MKKKLIAIVASLAMVATMVPASAFAASVELPIDKSKDVTAKTTARLSIETGYKTNDAKTNVEPITNSALRMTTYGTKSKVEGWLPYAEHNTDYNTIEGQSGHFVDMKVSAGDLGVNGEIEAVGFATVYPAVEYDYTGTAAAGPFVHYPVWKLSGQRTSDRNYSVRLDDLGGIYEVQILQVKTGWDNTKDGSDPVVALLPHGSNDNIAFTNTGNLPSGIVANDKHLYPMSKLGDVIDANKNDTIAKAELSIDYSNVLLLSKDDTADLDYFVNTASSITGTIDRTYVRNVQNTEDAYNELSDAAKQAVTYSVDNEIGDAAATAYAKLETGQKNVEAYNKLDSIATLVKAIPTWKAEYANDADIVAQVEAAVRAVNAEKKLSETVYNTLMNPINGYLTQADIDNYNAAKNGVNDKAVSEVIAKIDALVAITGDFSDQASVEAIAKPWKEACEAYEDLGDDKVNVTNASTLRRYTNTYKAAIEKYANPIWETVADINIADGLTTENRAKVAELKSYIDNEYINTTEMNTAISIEDFDKKIYNKLVEALNGANENVYSLEKATVEAIAEQTYTGKAIKPAIVVKDGEGNEIAAENYYVSYDNNLEVGEATVTIVAKATSDYYGEAAATFTIKPAALTADMVQVANATYTGKALKPAVSVASGVDYTVAYKNNTAVGKASAVVTGTGNYTGTITKNFIVKPAKESITSLKAGKKQITVAYKAQTGAKYRVICKASGLKAIGTNTTATKKTVKKLKSGKTYQVKVRAYKAVDGKTYYGTYSAVKKIKVK